MSDQLAAERLSALVESLPESGEVMRYTAAYNWTVYGPPASNPLVYHYDGAYSHSAAMVNADPCPKCTDGYLLYQIRRDADCCTRCGFERPL